MDGIESPVSRYNEAEIKRRAARFRVFRGAQDAVGHWQAHTGDGHLVLPHYVVLQRMLRRLLAMWSQ